MEGNMNLREMQNVVYKNKIDKGFNVTDVNKEFCLLYGEVAEAIEINQDREYKIIDGVLKRISER